MNQSPQESSAQRNPHQKPKLEFAMNYDRRALFASLGAAAAGHMMLADAVAAENSSAAQVADRTSTIRVTGLRATWVNPNVFVRIETNHGIVGWGDLKGVDPRRKQT